MKKFLLVAIFFCCMIQVHANASTESPVNQNRFFVEWGVYTGYELDVNGCWRHGTFVWSGTPQNHVFVPDNGCNNSNSCSVGFEDFCMSDEEFSGFC